MKLIIPDQEIDMSVLVVLVRGLLRICIEAGIWDRIEKLLKDCGYKYEIKSE